MKTTQATINLVLNVQRKNKDGLCPVVLRVFWKGRKENPPDASQRLTGQRVK